ncbi:MAG: histidine kinase dimerization/phospho-acceptor domain-containing protein [Kofleriaceae bacterium]
MGASVPPQAALAAVLRAGAQLLIERRADQVSVLGDARAVLGVDADALRGVDDLAACVLDEAAATAVRRGELTTTTPLRWRRPDDGAEVWIARTPVEGGGELWCDVSVEQHRARADAETIAAMRSMLSRRSEFMTGIAHELRTPLNSILGFGELLRDGHVEPGTAEHQEFLGDIVTSGRAMLALVNDLVDLAKLEAGQLELRARVCRPLEITRELVAGTGAAGETRAPVTLELGSGVDAGVEASMDPDRVRQLVGALVGLGQRLAAPGAVVQLHVATRADVLRWQIGGLELKMIGARTDATTFETLELATTRRQPAVAFGLALGRLLARAMGGCAGVEPASTGDALYVELPRRGVASC